MNRPSPSQGEHEAGPPQRLDVVHFILDHRVGGPHVYVDSLRRAMSAGVRGRLVTAGRGDLTDIALLNLRQVWRLLYPLEVLLNAGLIALRFGLWRRPALFHVHGAANTAPLIAALLCRMPVVWHFHETTATHARLARWGLGLVRRCPRHRLLTVAQGSDALLSASGSSGERAALVPGLVDTGFWQAPAAEPVAAGPSARAFQLIAVANLNPLKGIDLLLEALPLVGRPIALQVIGAALQTQQAFTERLERQAAALAASHSELSVCFSGAQKAEAIRIALAGADAFVLPSRSEACPIALLEAMAMGLPCAATDVGAVRDMLPPASQACVCPPEQPPALAAALRFIIDLPVDDRKRLGALNRQAALGQFSPDRIAALVLHHYRAVLDPSR